MLTTNNVNKLKYNCKANNSVIDAKSFLSNHFHRPVGICDARLLIVGTG